MVTVLVAAVLSFAPRTGEDVVRAMHARYAGTWYKTLTFVQKTTQPDGRVETWYEALSMPGLLRIDIAPLDSGKAIIFRNDSLFILNGGKIQASRPMIHPLLVLGFDVYVSPVENTLEKLKALKFDLTKLHTDTWQGRPVYVVGADAGDTTTSQFWVDQENLLFVRMLQPAPIGGVNETQFNKYVKLGKAWISPEVLFFTNGQPGNREEYSDMRVGMTFEPGLFDPVRFKPAGWIQSH
jgi:hypothetical protein